MEESILGKVFGAGLAITGSVMAVREANEEFDLLDPRAVMSPICVPVKLYEICKKSQGFQKSMLFQAIFGKKTNNS